MNYSRVCIAGSVYTLFIYLITSTEEQEDNTFYFFSSGINPKVRGKFKNSQFLCQPSFSLSRIAFFCNLRYRSVKRWKFLETAEIFGADHLCITPGLLGDRQMVVVEDGLANYLPAIMKKPNKPFKAARKLIHGSLKLDARFGAGDQVKEVILTGITTIPEVLRPKAKVVNVKKLWNSMCAKRKSKILSYFSLTDEDITVLRQKKSVLFTQPLVLDAKMDEVELAEVYRKILDGVDYSNLVIKTHPRDTVDYSKYFPGVLVFNKVVPMELLSLLDVDFDDAYTISTTAVFSLPSTTNIHFSGTTVHPVIEGYCGRVTMDMFNR